MMLRLCSWCHEVNDVVHFKWCATCGHRADRPRSECNCYQCESFPQGWLNETEKEARREKEQEEQRSRIRDA